VPALRLFVLSSAAFAGVVWLAGARTAAAQSTDVDPAASSALAAPALSLVAGAPPAPVAPATITRDDDGRATVRAVRLMQPMRVDGALDEAIYRDVPPMSDFIQVDPSPGAAATEKTDVWVSFDSTTIYVSARAWDTQMDRLVATEMRRDSNVLFQGNDVISIAFDPFYDRRNGLLFTVNPIGGRSDTQVTGERQFSQDWNPVWAVKTGRFEGGWTAEMAIPFKSMRYGAGTAQVWGFNVMRIKRSKNEISLLTKVPPGRGQAAIVQTAFAASLVGLETPRSGRNLDIKPYAISSLTTDRVSTPRLANDPKGEVGLDLKYGLTQGLTADLTVNTDFAQVEADEQQVNLTRFSLFFPEKREFFLENQGTFAFGGVQLAGNNNNNNATTAPILFYSRRIGLNQGREVPLELGGRISGRAGRYSMGVLNTQTGDDPTTGSPATNFSVVRLRRDVLRRSSVGLIATGRSVAQNGVGRNLAYGLDGTFAFFDNLSMNAYWAKTETDGLRGKDTSYRGQLDYNGDRYGLQIEHIGVGDNFNPEVGFLRRDNMYRSSYQARFSPRPKNIKAVRKFRYQTGLSYLENGSGILETRERDAEFAIEFQNGDQFSVQYNNLYEYLPLPFRITNSVTIPVGGYRFQNGVVGFNLGRQRTISANASLEHGTFYNGHRTTFSVSQGRVSVTNAIAVEPTYSLNKVDLIQGRFTTHLAGSRVTYTLTPLMFTSALLQYNSGTSSVSVNARLRWEYRPGSELFVVYNEDRNTLTRSFPSTNTRAIIVKINRLFRY
jgi:hypothetical protein